MKFRLIAPLAALLALAALPASALASTTLSIKPAGHAFGKLPVGKVRTTTFTVKNTGTTRSGVLSDAISGPGAAAFWTGSDSCDGRRLAAGASCRAQVRFGPSSPGSYSATYTLSEAGTAVSAQAWLSGTGTGSTPASLEITPFSYTFTSVVATSSGTQTFTLQNTGGSPTTLAGSPTLSDTNGVYSVENDSCANATLAAGASCTFDLRFSPVDMGCCGPGTGYSTSVEYYSTDSSVYQGFAIVSGFPMPPLVLSPNPLDFPDTAVGSTSRLPVTVTNTGGADIVPTFTGGGGFDNSFSLQYIETGDTTNPDYATRCVIGTTVLGAGDSCTLDGYFFPQAEGTVQEQYTLYGHRPASSDTGEYQSDPVTLSGTGTAAP